MKAKTILIVIVFFALMCGKTQAQTYTPFPDSNAVWSVLDFSQFYPFSLKYQTIQYAYGNDTTINYKTYHKIYSNTVDTIILTSSMNTIYLGSLRQDTALRKVYFIPKDSINDILFYDFDINNSDTVNIQTNAGVLQSYQCYGIGYFLFSDGIERKCYQMLALNGYTWDTWIEGIGSVRGLFNHFNIYKWYNELLCFNENGTLVYQMDSLRYWDYPYNDSSVVLSGCYHNNLIISTKDNYSSQELCYSFPNPFTNTTVISLPEHLVLNAVSIDIVDIQGRLIKTHTKLNSHLLTLKREDFGEAGVYFLRVISANYLETIKLIVQ